VARGALQVVGDRPVVLVAELVLDELRDHGPDATQLCVAEGVPGAGVGQNLPSAFFTPSETTMAQ